MGIEILPSNTVQSNTTVTVRETTLRPGDQLVITTDTHLAEIDLKISDLVSEDLALKAKINEISNKLLNALNGARLIGICPNTKAEVLANKQLLTDFVNGKFTNPSDQLQPGDVVSTSDKFTFVYLSNGSGGYEWREYNVTGDVGDILTRLDELELSKTDIERKITDLENYKDSQILKNAELDSKITDLESSDTEILNKIGDLQAAGYTSNNAGQMFKEIKSGLESLNTKTESSIREMVARLSTFVTDITSQVQTAESRSIQASMKSEANVTAIADIKATISNLQNKDVELETAIGTLGNLQTGNRVSLVEAVNEVFNMVNALTGGSSGGGIEATVLKLSTAVGSVDTLGGETIVGALGKLNDAINLKASTQALNEVLTKIGSDAINGELTQNVIGALNDLLIKVRELDNKFDNYLGLTGGEVTGAITYNGVDNFTAKQVPHVEWIENNLNTKIGEMSTIGTTEFSTIAGAIKEVNALAKKVELDLISTNDKIGNLADTGYTDNASVVSCLKEIKGITDSIISDNTATKQKVTDLENNKADKTSIEAINEKLSLMEGASVVIDIISETKDEVEGQSDKNSFLEGKVTDTGKPSVEEGYEIRTSDGYSYIYKNGQWKLVSLPPVSLASESNAGIVKFKEEEGYITGSSAGDGTMILKGYTELKNKVEDNTLALDSKVAQDAYNLKISSIESSVTANGQLAQEAKTKAEENALLVAANSSKADDAIAKATNAESIATSADSKADNANTIASEAKTESASALVKANTADQNATEAKAQSQQAETTATEAMDKANEAKTVADEAKAKSLEVEAKVGDISGITGTPATVVEAIEALRSITGELSSINGIDNSNLASSIIAIKDKVEEVNTELSKYALLTGSQFTGVNSYDGTINSFTGAEIPHATWVETKLTDKIGSMSGTGLTNTNTVSDALKEVKDNLDLKAASTEVTAISDKIGDLSITGITSNTTVSSSLTELVNSINTVTGKIGSLVDAGFNAKDTVVNILKEIRGYLEILNSNNLAVENKVGALDSTGLTSTNTVAEGLKELKDSITALENKDTSVLQDIDDIKLQVEANKASITAKEQAANLRLQSLENKDTELEAKDTELDGKIQLNAASIANTQNNLDSAKVELNTNITAVSNKIGDLATTGVPSGSNGTVAGSIKHIKDRLTSVERADTDITASIEEIRNQKADVSVVEAISEELALVKGATVVTCVLTESKADVEGKSDKQDFLTTKAKESGKKTMKDGFVVRTSDGYMYYYFKGTWYLVEKVEVTNATTSNPGLIKYKDQLGYVTTGDGDGTAQVKGFTELYNQVDGMSRDLTDKVTEAQVESLVDGKVAIISAKVDGFDSRLTTNETKANTAVNEVATLSQTVTEHTRAIQALRTDSIGNIASTGFDGTNVGDMFRSVRSEVDERITATEAERQIREAFNNINSKITTVDGKVDTKLSIDAFNTEKQSLATKDEVSAVDDKLGTLTIDGLTGTTVTDLLTDASNKLDERYTKDEVIDLIEHETDSQFNDSIFKYREVIPGLDNIIATSNLGPVYRIPSITLSKNGTVHIVADCRMNGNDQYANEIVYARSVDGGKKWTKQVIGHRYKGTGYSEQRSRVMDPTILDAGDGKLFVLAGRWITGSNNWTANNDSANNWSAALLMKSTNDGLSWSQHTIGKADCTSQEGTHIVVQNLRPGCKGFLGGINPGFRHSSGKLVFQIQFTTGVGDAKSTLLVSEDEGLNWRMASGDTGGVNYECSMIELPDGSIVLHTRSEDGDSVVNGKSTKKAYITRDFGETFTEYAPLSKKIGSKRSSGGGNRCEGGTLGATTISGNYICAAAYPQVTADSELGHTSDWARNQITLYACNLNDGTATPIQMIQYRSGLTPIEGDGEGSATTGTPYGGYSSLIYKQTDDGEYIICVYEDELGISIKNLSNLISRLEIYSGNIKANISDDKVSEIVTTVKDEVNGSLSADLSTEVKNDVMTTVVPQIKTEVVNSVMEEVENKTSAWPTNFTHFIDTHIIPNDNGLKIFGPDMTSIGSLAVGDSFLTSGSIDNTKIELSNVLEGGLFIKTTADGNYSIKGPVTVDSSANVLSFTFGICIPTGANIKNYTPLVRFFNSDTSTKPGNIVGGLEITSAGEVCVTKAKNAGNSYTVGQLEKDRVYTVGVEYTSSGVKVYFDGKLKGTYDSDSSKRDGLREATYMCITGQGSTDKHFNGHIGNVVIYNRALTEDEKTYGRWFNGKNGFISNFERTNDVEKKIKTIENRIEEVREETSNIASDVLRGIGVDVNPIGMLGRFLEGSSIDTTGRTWTSSVGSEQFTWSTGASNIVISKETDKLKVVSSSGTVNNSDINKFPSITLGNKLAGATGLTLIVKAKYLDISSLEMWPALCSITKTNSSIVDIFNIGITRSSSTNNLNYNYHVKRNWGSNDTTGNGPYYQGNIAPENAGNPSSSEFNVIAFVLKDNNVKIYSNTTVIGDFEITPIDLTELDKIYLGFGNRFSKLTKVLFEEVLVLKRAIKLSELRKVCNPSLIIDEAPAWYSDIISRLNALELRP